MAGETPDYGRLSAQATVFPVTDLGELAARLGSIVSHDRRGDVIWLDGFEDGLDKWQPTTSGSGAAVDLGDHETVGSLPLSFEFSHAVVRVDAAVAPGLLHTTPF